VYFAQRVMTINVTLWELTMLIYSVIMSGLEFSNAEYGINASIGLLTINAKSRTLIVAALSIV
jgi:hypothetical protein